MNAKFLLINFPATATEVATATGGSFKYTATLLRNEVKKGNLLRLENGVFALPVVEASTPEAKLLVKVCKKVTTHGEHRVTKSGSYCFACDRIVAEAQKAARAAAKVA